MNHFEEPNSTDTAIIPKGTIINGNISITDRLEMYGEINGDISSANRVDICGEVTGNINAEDLHAKDSYIVGQVACVQEAVIHENTVVLGDINAQNLVIEGAVQGQIDIKNKITVGEKAIVESDIKAREIQINNGAVLNGHCSLCYSDIDVKEVFPVTEEPEEEKPEEVNEAEKQTEVEESQEDTNEEPSAEAGKPEKAEEENTESSMSAEPEKVTKTKESKVKKAGF